MQRTASLFSGAGFSVVYTAAPDYKTLLLWEYCKKSETAKKGRENGKIIVGRGDFFTGISFSEGKDKNRCTDHRRRNVRDSVRAFSGTVRSIHGTVRVTAPDLRRTEP